MLAGTRLGIGMLMQDARSSAFEQWDITFLEPLSRVSANKIKEVLRAYFPCLRVSDYVANRWRGRARMLFEWLLVPLIAMARTIDNPETLQVTLLFLLFYTFYLMSLYFTSISLKNRNQFGIKGLCPFLVDT